MTIFDSMLKEAKVLPSGLKYLVRLYPHKPDHSNLFIWQPKAKKNHVMYTLKNSEIEKRLTEYEDRLIRHNQFIKEKRERSKATPDKMKQIEIGQIYYSSYGYEQTNIDFYQVTSIKKCMVGFRKIRSERVGEDTSWCSCNVTAMKDSFKGDEFFHKANFSLSSVHFTISSCKTAFLWDGKPTYCSWGY